MAATGPKLVIPPHEGTPGAVDKPEVRIEYAAELIDRIRAETVNAFLALAHGGLEIAGVLFGTRQGDTVYLSASRPIRCEHAAGPSFILSARDEQQLDTLLADSRNDPELDGLEALGWYVSHTRRPPHLTPGDADIFERLFPEPLQFTAVIQPETTGAAQFRWFVRNEEGEVDRERPSYEFTVQSPAPAPRLPATAGLPDKGSSVITMQAPRGLQRVQQPRALAAPISHGLKRVRVSNVWLASIGLVIMVAATGALWWLGHRSTVASAPPLHVLDTGTQLRIEWDPKSPAVRAATAGILQIRDVTGLPVRLSLSPEMIRNGSVLYNKPSDKVEILLKLRDDQGEVTTSMVYFIAQEQLSSAIKPVPPLLREEAPRPDPITVLEQPPVRQPVKKTDPVTTLSSGSAERAAAKFRPPTAKKVVPVGPALIEPPKISTIPLVPQTQSGALLAPLPVASLHPDAAPPPAVVSDRARQRLQDTPAQSTSGRLIWTGELRKNAVLHITDRGASVGSLNGKLPAQTVKISARSAELLDGAIAVYTSDSNGNSKAEAPSRRNGWNVTLYKFDPKHAHDVAIVETPAEKNNWKLGIKSVNRPVRMIVIDWQAAGNQP